MQKNNKDNILFRSLKWISEFTTKHWLINSVFITGASWWFSLIISFFGSKWNLISEKDGNRSLTTLGLSITILIFILLVLNTVLNKYKKDFPGEIAIELEKTKNELDEKIAGFNLLDKVMYCISGICKKKYSTQMKTIVAIKDNHIEPPVVYSDPCEQLEIILEKLTECLSFLLSANNHKFEKSDLYVSIAYNFPEENKNVWKWVDIRDEKGLTLEELTQPGTTFSYLLTTATEREPFVFFNSKQTALNDGKYKPDTCDMYDSLTHHLKGSIACFRINLKKSDTCYITAVLSISSYDKPFVLSKDENDVKVINIKTNINNLIVSEFSERIKVELCNYYIQYMRSKWEQNQNSNYFNSTNNNQNNQTTNNIA